MGLKSKSPTGEIRSGFDNTPGDALLSHKVALAVPSALEGLTAVFGMGTGVAPPLISPGISFLNIWHLGAPRIATVESFALCKFYGQASRPISTRKLR